MQALKLFLASFTQCLGSPPASTASEAHTIDQGAPKGLGADAGKARGKASGGQSSSKPQQNLSAPRSSSSSSGSSSQGYTDDNTSTSAGTTATHTTVSTCLSTALSGPRAGPSRGASRGGTPGASLDLPASSKPTLAPGATTSGRQVNPEGSTSGRQAAPGVSTSGKQGACPSEERQRGKAGQVRHSLDSRSPQAGAHHQHHHAPSGPRGVSLDTGQSRFARAGGVDKSLNVRFQQQQQQQQSEGGMPQRRGTDPVPHITSPSGKFFVKPKPQEEVLQPQDVCSSPLAKLAGGAHFRTAHSSPGHDDFEHSRRLHGASQPGDAQGEGLPLDPTGLRRRGRKPVVRHVSLKSLLRIDTYTFVPDVNVVEAQQKVADSSDEEDAAGASQGAVQAVQDVHQDTAQAQAQQLAPGPQAGQKVHKGGLAGLMDLQDHHLAAADALIAQYSLNKLKVAQQDSQGVTASSTGIASPTSPAHRSAESATASSARGSFEAKFARSNSSCLRGPGGNPASPRASRANATTATIPEGAELVAAAPAGEGTPAKDSNVLAVGPTLPRAMRRPVWSAYDFSVLKRLHQGYGSHVYFAECKQSKMPVVLKVYKLAELCDLQRVQLFREIRVHSKLQHPNIIEFYAAFMECGCVVIVQEYAAGGDLLKYLHRQGGRLPERPAVEIVLHPLLCALQYLHTQQVVHRDLKPENCLLTQDLVLKLADFGLSVDLRIERANTRAGTLDYMAPEVICCPAKETPDQFKTTPNAAHYDVDADAWAVGVFAYEVLLGSRPFKSQQMIETARRIVCGEIRYPSSLSEGARGFIQRCLSPLPTDRPSVADMLSIPWIVAHSRRKSLASQKGARLCTDEAARRASQDTPHHRRGGLL